MFFGSAKKENDEWEEKPHNKKIMKVVNGARLKKIREADERSKERYDHIDRQIEGLRTVRTALREGKVKLRPKGA